ncbi:MAG: hypothetical protein QMD13_10330, partial [Candidatus Bathyarchaeia archaeon]|nr:hypothetical protein [Candidatus Bathyarchaeia archaeon]
MSPRQIPSQGSKIQQLRCFCLRRYKRSASSKKSRLNILKSLTQFIHRLKSVVFLRDSYKDVDLYDVVAICVAYCSKKGDPDYNPNLDINCNGHIGLYDVVIACTHYGEKSESSTVSCRNNDLEFSMTLESTRI